MRAHTQMEEWINLSVSVCELSIYTTDEFINFLSQQQSIDLFVWGFLFVYLFAFPFNRK